MDFIKNLKIKNKLALILLVPLMGLLFFSWQVIADKYSLQKSLGLMEEYSVLAVKIDALIHAAQVERALTAGFVGSQFQKFNEDLSSQRIKTNKKIGQLKTYVNQLKTQAQSNDFVSELDASMAEFEKLLAHRQMVDGAKVNLKEATAFYGQLIQVYFNVIEKMKSFSPTAEVSNLFSAYVNFSRAKDKEDLERTLLSKVFANDSFSADEFKQFSVIDAEKEIYYRVFLSFASFEEVDFFIKTVSGSAVSEVDRMREVAFKKAGQGQFDIDAEHWFDMMSQKINLLKQVEDKMSQNLLLRMDQVKRGAYHSLNFYAAVAIAVFVVSLLIIYGISYTVLKPISKLKKATKLIAKGQTDVEIHNCYEDEVGDLAHAFKQMLANSKEVIKHARSIAKGDYTVLIQPRSNQDELAEALSEMMQALKEKTDENEKQNWLKTQIARISEISQGIADLPKLAQTLISELAKLVGAGQGLFYIRCENDTESDKEFVLSLLGSYAYRERKELNNQIKLGEGLVGQCALEKKPIALMDVPDNYLRIESGLGHQKPACILVLPLLFEEEVIGVLELASFNQFTPIQQELLDQISENLGVVIDSVMGRERTERLLKTSQKMTLTLQNQQEELRAANEEMEEQTKLLKESEAKLKLQSEELQASNEELEEKTLAIEIKNKEVEAAKQKVEEKAVDLEAASKYKSEFLANMSHELRTPLNSLLILAKSLADNDDGNLTEEQIEAAQVIHSGGKDLLNLINDILDLSKVEAGKLDVHYEEVFIATITGDMKRQFSPVAKQKGVELVIEAGSDLPKGFTTDIQRVQQILKNLLSNAFKFTSKGSVSLKVHWPDDAVDFYRPNLQRGQVLAFSVVDTGLGIAKEKQEAIFEAFRQADGSTSRKYGGTGLGLAISREMSHLLKGEVQLVSVEGKGSTFTLYLPLGGDGVAARCAVKETESPSTSVAQPETDTLPGLRDIPEFLPDDRSQISAGDKSILVIEDDIYFARILMNLARKKGYQCLAAQDGKSGLSLANHYKPSAVILDMGLPDMDGMSVLEALKKADATQNIPVHIASARDADNKPLEKGAIGYLSKPATPEAIDQVFLKIEKIIKTNIKEVLIIEPDKRAQESLVHLIQNSQAHISVAETGQKACKLFEASNFDCVILDLDLPDMQGNELLDKMASIHLKDMPPVIIYTSQELSAEEHKDLSRYADSIVVKGMHSKERLLDETTLFLHSLESSLPAEKKATKAFFHEPEKALKGKTILLVDDDLRNTFALSNVLKKKGLTIIMADNGQMALEKIESEPNIDLVIMDIMMPVMDGYEAMKNIRAKGGQYLKLPMIALTAKAMPEDRQKCLDAGASDYMTKPVDVDKLVSMMRVWLFSEDAGSELTL